MLPAKALPRWNRPTHTHTDRQTDLIHIYIYIYIYTQALTGTTTRSARAIDGMESLF